MNSPEHVDLPGSARPAPTDATRVRTADAQQRVRLTVTLAGPALPGPDAVPAPGLSGAEFARRYSARAEDAERVGAALGRYGLAVDDTSLATRSMHVSGTVAQVEAAFRTTIDIYRGTDGSEFRARAGRLEVPAGLVDVVTGVFGIDERRVAHRRRRPVVPSASPLTPADLERRYGFPAGSGAGQKIAVAEFGGGWFPDDVSAFCARHGIPDPVATIATVSVGLPVLTLADIEALPGPEQRIELAESGEVMMDVEIIAALCPAADISVYFAPFSEQGWVDLLDRVALARPVALSVSWGSAETSANWSRAALQAIDERLSALATLGVTTCVAAGDDGSGDGLADGAAHVDFPASSPFVLGVGGTMIDAAGREVTWREPPGQRQGGGGATGGGVSAVFGKPTWQKVDVGPVTGGGGSGGGAFAGRIVPDVAALAGPPFYDLVLLGADAPNGGTSASAPVWAALLARVAASLPAGAAQRFLTPLLYADDGSGSPAGATVCHDVAAGTNTSDPDPGFGYAAGPGYDAVTGWGTPNGAALRALLTRHA